MAWSGARLLGTSLLVVLTASLLTDALPAPRVPLPADSLASPAAAPSAAAPDLAGAFGGQAPSDLQVLDFGTRTTFLPPQPAAAPGAAPQLQFRCPRQNLPASPPDPQNLGDKTTYGCPYRVYDGSDAKDGFPLGNPQIAVNPSNAAEAAFVSLHDQPAPNGPTPRARQGLTHTTFTTADQGFGWEDQPTQYGGSADGVAYLGESASIAMDPSGNMYIAYLWVLPNGNETTGYGGAIGLFKAGTPHDRGSVSASYSNQRTIPSRTSHNIIPRVDVVYVPPYVPPVANVTAENGTLVPATDAEAGQEAVVVNHTRERVVAMWFEKAADWRNSTTGMPGWIDAAVTDTSSRNSWQRLGKEQLIGPCRDASNPVAWNGLVYVACQVERGYDARTRARIGDIDVWALDPMTHNTTLVSTTGLRGGHPMLAATADGYMVLLAVTHRPDETLDVNSAYGWYGRGWAPHGNLGPELHRMGGSIPLLDASINAVAVSEREKTVAVVYMEWAQKQGALPAQPAPALPDPSKPTATPTPILTDFRKYVVAFNECTFPLASSQMQLGTSVDPNNLNAYMQKASIFDDFQDGLVAYREPTGEDLFYFAVDDYGAMQYGAVVTQAVGSFCPLTAPLFSASPAAIPQALTVASPTSMAIGATAGVAAAAMVAYILTVKRRVAHFAVAEDK